ncbi:MAG TPA: LamG domain-containing protein, partial [Armatimonadetes bacterium]|nr:LamG domain-containing protein [Armatimonadota bacterium]
LFSPAGFLDDNWWHRTYWVFGKHFYAGYIGWFFAGREVPAGRILTFNESTIYGFAYKPSYYRNITGWKYHLFATDISQVKQPPPDYTRAQREFRVRNMFKVKFKWTVDVPLLVRAMIQANDLLFLAGPPQRALRSMTAYEGKRGGLLIVVSTKDGSIVRSYRLNFLPTFDGMAGIAKKLFMTTTDGRVICLGAEGKPLLAMHPERRVKGKPVEEGLVGYWKFDDGKGDTAMDSSGRGNDAEVCGTWVMGKFGTCIYTDGLPGAITICDDPDFQFGTSDFSIAFWVKPDAFGKRIMGKENFPRNWWVINLLDDGRVELVLGETRASGKVARARSKTPLSTRAWNCVTFVVDRKAFTIHCYINGKLDSVTKIPPTLTGSLSVVEHDILIPSAFKPFVGLIDELKIY